MSLLVCKWVKAIKVWYDMKPCTSFRTSCPLLFSPDLVVMQMYHAYNRCTVLTHLSQTSSLYSSSIIVLWGIHTRGNLYQIYIKKCMNHHRIMKGVYIWDTAFYVVYRDSIETCIQRPYKGIWDECVCNWSVLCTDSVYACFSGKFCPFDFFNVVFVGR